MILQLVDEAKEAGARRKAACRILGLDASTVERWRVSENQQDLRRGPISRPKHALNEAERAEVLKVANSPEFRDVSPHQIVPRLADSGKYLCSEATMYRVLRDEKQVKHREPSRKPSKRHRPKQHVATGPNQVWSWDITYLRRPERGTFFYLYMLLDVWSRKIVGWQVHETEESELATWLMEAACGAEKIERGSLVLYSDNGSPMKSGTTLAKLQQLGVAASFSRPSVSNDNPFSEACFRTVKYRPSFPSKPFETLASAREWVADFVRWYNTEHQHSGVRFLTPQDRHDGKGPRLLENRKRTYSEARDRNPGRWTGSIRNWSNVNEVILNPTPSLEVVAMR